jgi:hypothetical protein
LQADECIRDQGTSSAAQSGVIAHYENAKQQQMRMA